MHDTLLLANETLLVTFTKVGVEFVVAVETFLAEIAHWMRIHIRFPLLVFVMCVPPERRHVYRVLTGRVSGMLVGKDLLVANTEITENAVVSESRARSKERGSYHNSFP